MSLDAARAFFERQQMLLFRDEATVTRGSGTPTFNPATGVTTTVPGATVYTGECLIRGTSWQGFDVGVGETEVRSRTVRGWLPKDTAVEVNDVLTVTASTHDAGMVGRVMRITDVPKDGWQVVRKVLLEEITA